MIWIPVRNSQFIFWECCFAGTKTIHSLFEKLFSFSTYVWCLLAPFPLRLLRFWIPFVLVMPWICAIHTWQVPEMGPSTAFVGVILHSIFPVVAYWKSDSHLFTISLLLCTGVAFQIIITTWSTQRAWCILRRYPKIALQLPEREQ